jgi:hypothetical protein
MIGERHRDAPPVESLCPEAHTLNLGGPVTSRVALMGWKVIGGIALLVGIIAPTVHLLFALGGRPSRRSQDGHRFSST